MLGHSDHLLKCVLASNRLHVWVSVDYLPLARHQLLPRMIIQNHHVGAGGQREFPIAVFVYELFEQVVGVGAGGYIE